MTDTVLVLGPPLSGAGAVAAALRRRLHGCTVVEPGQPAPGRIPDAVVFVTSAAAPMTDCDAVLLAAAAARTDAVVGAVSKIDLHRTWRAVVDANSRALQCAPVSRVLPWVGVAADPDVGPVVIGPLVDAVRTVLDDDGRRWRNQVRALEWAARRRVAEQQRLAVLRARAARRNAVRARAQQARIDLAAQARAGCARLRADLHRDAVGAPLDTMRHRVRRRAQRAVDDFECAVLDRIAEVFADAGTAVPALPPAPVIELPPHRQTSQEDRLSTVLGTGFGAGVALTLGRFLAALVPVAAGVVVAVCCVVGLALAAWVVRTRRSVTARAAMERWSGEVAATVRSALEQRLLAAESVLLGAYVDVNDDERAGGRSDDGIGPGYADRRIGTGAGRARGESQLTTGSVPALIFSQDADRPGGPVATT